MLIVNYSIPCLLLQNLPWVGHVLSFLVMSFVDGFFCFEQVWSVRGWPLEKRLRFAESHWSFLMGFGVPSTLVSFFHPSGLLNLMLFMLVFPICTLLAFLAVPQPHSAALGAQTAMLPSTVHGAGNAQNTPLAWCLPARIPLFWPTVRFRRWVSTRMATEMPPLIPRKPMSASQHRSTPVCLDHGAEHVARDTAAFCRLLCRWRMVHAPPRTYGLGSPRRLA